jgi:hypothetical protein
MHFVFYPKHEFGCLHVTHCPHLGGASLGSLVDALRAEGSARYHKIQELTAQVEQLQRELTAERQKQFQRKRERIAEEEPESTKSQGPQKRGAPVGHPGWYRRRPVEFDKAVFVPVPARCPHCGGSVKARPDRPVYEHLQEDWIGGQRVAICYRHEARRCRKCRRWVRSAGPGELLRAMIGPHLRAVGMFLQYDIGLTTRKVVRTVAGLAEFDFVPASGKRECEAKGARRPRVRRARRNCPVGTTRSAALMREMPIGRCFVLRRVETGALSARRPN